MEDTGRGMTSERTRERLIQRIQAQGIQTPAILDRIRQIPRHLFVDEAIASRAYEDTSLPIGNQQTLSQPYIVARMTDALLAAGPLHNVLEIGTGSGYQTAVLAPLVRRVYTVERIAALLDQAKQRFQQLQLRNIRTRHADGNEGWVDRGPYDGIIMTAAPAGIPLTLVQQLRPGGIMILPVGDQHQQALVQVTRTTTGHTKEVLEAAHFVPLLTGTT